MTDSKLDSQLRHALRTEERTIPAEVRDKIEATLASLPDRKRARRFPRPLQYAAVTAATVLCVSLVAGFISPSAAQMLSRIPFVGSVFEYAGDAGLEQSSRHGLATVVHETAADQGIELTLNEVIYDGVRLSVGLSHHPSQQVRLIPGADSLQVDGRNIHYSAGGVSRLISDEYEATVFKFTPSESLPSEFNLSLTFHEVVQMENGKRTSVQGEWKFETKVQQLQEGIYTHTFHTPIVKSDGEVTIELHEVVFTPITTMIAFDWIEPLEQLAIELPAEADKSLQPDNSAPSSAQSGALTPPPPPDAEWTEEDFPLTKTEEHISFELLNADGYQLEPLSVGSRGTMMDGRMVNSYTAMFAPMESAADRLLFRPVKQVVEMKRIGPGSYVSANEPVLQQKEINGDYPITISQGEAGSVTLNEIEFASDQTVIHYEVHGQVPYSQDSAFWLVDREGNEYRFSRLDQERLAGDGYKYKAYLPPIPDTDGLSVQSVELEAPHILTDLTISIPIGHTD